MRILVASPFLPHPGAAHGGGVYLTALLDGLATRAEVCLVSFATRAEVDRRARPAAALARVEIVARPQLGEVAGAGRAAQRAANLGRWLAGSPLYAAKFGGGPMRAVLSRAVETFRPDACLVEFAVMAQYLPALAGRPRVLTDHEAGVAVPARIGPGTLGQTRDRRLWERYVRREYPRAELLQALNEDDAADLAARLGRPVEVRPAVVDVPARAVEPGRAPPRALFFGDWSHHPNPEAAAHLVRRVWPRIRARVADAELWLAGPRGDRAALEALATEAPGVAFRGFVPDLGQLLGAARCLVAPLLSGAGSRIKVLTALAHGLPVVANALGLRGVDAPASAAHVAETDADLAAAVVALLESPDAAAEAGQVARQWAREQLSVASVAAAQLTRVERLLAALGTGR